MLFLIFITWVQYVGKWVLRVIFWLTFSQTKVELTCRLSKLAFAHSMLTKRITLCMVGSIDAAYGDKFEQAFLYLYIT